MPKILVWTLFLCFLFSAPLWAQEENSRTKTYQNTKETAFISNPLLVLVEISFVPFNNAEGEKVKDFYSLGRSAGFVNNSILENAANRRPYITDGYVVADNRILIADPYFKWERVQSLRVLDFAGVSYPATFYGILKDADGVLLKCDGLSFSVNVAEKTTIDLNENYFHVSLAGNDYQRNISVKGASVASFFDWNQNDAIYGFTTALGLIFNKNKDFVGFTLPKYSTSQPLSYFYPGSLKAKDVVSQEKLKEYQAQILKSVQANLAYFKITFRKGNSRQFGRNEAKGKEYEGYGYVYQSGALFVPQNLSLKEVEIIKKIDVEYQGNKIEGSFGGLFKEFGGFLISAKVEPSETEFFAEIQAETSRTLVFSVLSKHRFGKLHSKIYFSHFAPAKKRGYKGVFYSNISHRITPGSVYVLLEDSLEKGETPRLAGFGLSEKKYDNLGSKPNDFRYTLETPFFMDYSHVRKRLEHPANYLDPKAKIKSSSEAKELVWLGVEFQFINRRLSEVFKVQGVTKNGNLGLLIKDIYPNSPAKNIGLKVGDILLKVQEKGKDEINFYQNRRYSYYYPGRRAGYPTNAWFRRVNFLTSILTKMGPGAKATLTYYSDGKVNHKEITLQKAPKDFSSAEKHKEDRTGLTVKDITYEIRRRLKLPADFKGVIVYRVERGSSASVARIQPLDFIETIDQKPIGSTADFQKVIDELVANKKQIVKFRVRTFDETRFVDVRLIP